MFFLLATQKERLPLQHRALMMFARSRTFLASVTRKTLVPLLMLGMSGLATEAIAQSGATENLIQAPPKGFKMVNRDIDKTSATIYMIPEDQTPASWDERVSTQIIYNPKSTSYFAFRGEQQRHWQELCDASSVDYAKDGMQNGYKTHLWLQACRFRDTKKKPIFGLAKMIDGREHTYVVQVVFRYAPDDANLAHWASYLDSVQLCGSQTGGPACPRPATTP